MSKYKKIKKEIAVSDWPPVGQVTYMSANLDEDHNDTQVYVDSIALEGSINLSWHNFQFKLHAYYQLILILLVPDTPHIFK